MISDYWRFLLSAGDVHVRNQKTPKDNKKSLRNFTDEISFFFLFQLVCLFFGKDFLLLQRIYERTRY